MFALEIKSIPCAHGTVKSEMPAVSRGQLEGRSGSGFVPATAGRLAEPELTSIGCMEVERRWRQKKNLTLFPYFCNYRNVKKPDPLLVTRSADRFAALGAEPRLAILRLLLSAHPTGMIAGEVQEELEIPASTLSHHLEKLKQVGLIDVRRDGTFLWYSANTDALREVLGFLYEECCTRSRAVAPESFVQVSR
jgi:ArsR family transcriptional regulator, arsenate/arsenite/antimonite-responsive transcriptional repressor